MSDEQLADEAKRVQARMDSLAEVMQRTASDATGYPAGIPGATQQGYNQYRSAQAEYQRLQGRMAEVLDERARRSGPTVKAEGRKTFVNSFGEATTRYITSPGYERAQRRNDRAVLRNMGY